VPVETLVTENDEIQSIHIGDYATVVSPTDSTDHETQVVFIAENFRYCKLLVFVSFLAGGQIAASTVVTLAI
jgi:hypothetical protein